MTTEANADSPQPKLDAEAVTRKVLELIKASKTIADFTPEKISEVTGVEMKPYDANSHSATEIVTSDWRYVFDMSKATVNGPQFMFGFFPAEPGRSPPSSDICKMSLSRFSSELEGAGFSRETTYGEHGMIVNYLFNRNGLTARVSTIGNPDAPDMDSKECIHLVVIN